MRSPAASSLLSDDGDWATVYATEDGFSSVGWVVGLKAGSVAVRDPVLGDVDVYPDELIIVVHLPTLSVAFMRTSVQEVSEWRESRVMDWRTLLLLGVFCLGCSDAASYEAVAPRLRGSLDAPCCPPGHLYEGSASLVSLADYTPWLTFQLKDSRDFTRGFRNRMCLKQVPRGMSLRSFSLYMSMLGRDAATLIRGGGDRVSPAGVVDMSELAEHRRQEGLLRETMFYDLTHPTPYANAQWRIATRRPSTREDRPRPGRNSFRRV